MASRQSIDRVRVWRAGEFEGSAKVFLHVSRSLGIENLMTAKRCSRQRGTHDLETRQHRFSAFGLSWRKSTMWSRISGGQCFDIAVLVNGQPANASGSTAVPFAPSELSLPRPSAIRPTSHLERYTRNRIPKCQGLSLSKSLVCREAGDWRAHVPIEPTGRCSSRQRRFHPIPSC
jgi:hypothetical protein